MTRIAAKWLTAKSSQQVCHMLTDAGYQAWFVGGCVRNALIDAPVSDLDLSTDAHPKEVMRLARAADLKAIPTGIDHGTVTVVADGEPFEITTFRKDIATNGRHASVTYAETIADDARRRDFTMNALYADKDGNVADPLGGLPDLAARRVRFIEDPDQRIKEDYLRILRFFRFYAWYGDATAGIDPEGLAACADNVEGIQSLSRERITQELLKLLAAPDPAPAVASFAACGGLMHTLPGAHGTMLAPLVHLEHSIGLKPDPIRRLAMLGGVDVLEKLRLSKVQMRDYAVYIESGSAAKVAYHHGTEMGRGVLVLQNAMFGQEIDPADLSLIAAAEGKTFPVRAADFMPAYKGEALGEALRNAEARWIASGFELTKEDLLG